MAILRFLFRNFSITFPIFDLFASTRRSFQKVSDDDKKALKYSTDMDIFFFVRNCLTAGETFIFFLAFLFSADLVPVYHFGENRLFINIPSSENGRIQRYRV
jgi:hypothetical protein